MCLQKWWPMVVLCSIHQDIVVDEENDPSTASGTSPLDAPEDSLRVVVVVLMLAVPETKLSTYFSFCFGFLITHHPLHHNRVLQCFKLMQRRIIVILVLKIYFLPKKISPQNFFPSACKV